ncbi:hypothetical protein HELRODRAFT_187921 [Helobdella robusta]|uniref:Lebercilin domain-containing protein n=1 Tax=Helobdella robusta TaxID=6412 RepID=T1FPH1_HELRO|nr:hypothetical protein HELRODRAFT_187921 [Helobdella robusta]ESO12600.1 hypothetical protein HELRODRAFT_187921 [Helobdella robusta]
MNSQPAVNRNNKESYPKSNNKMSDEDYSDEDGSYRSGSYTESESNASYSDGGSKKTINDSKRDSKTPKKSQVHQKNPALVRGVPRGTIYKKRAAVGAGGDSVTEKVLSENKIKIGELRNKNSELLELISKYEYENRDLMRIIRKQEKQLKTFQEQENSMPVLIQRQTAESHAMYEQMRNLKEKLRNQEKKIKSADDELEQKQKQLKKMKALVDDSHLLERDELTQKLKNIEAELQNKSEIIRNLERHIENLNKNHKHELGLKKAKQQATVSEVDALRAEIDRMQMLLHEKEKELSVLNIYAQQRFQMKPPHRLTSSIRSTPVFDKQGNPQSMRGKKDTNINKERLQDHSRNQLVHNPNANVNINNVPTKQKRSNSPEIKLNKSLPNDAKVSTRFTQNMATSSTTTSTNPHAKQPNTQNKLHGINEEKTNKNREKEEIEKKIKEMERETKMKVMNQNGGGIFNSHNKKVLEESPSKDRMKAKDQQENQKEVLLNKMKEIDGSVNVSKSSSKQNVKKSIFDDDDDDLQFASYKPSFLNDTSNKSNNHNHKSSNKPVSVKKRDDLFSELFDDKHKDDDEDFIFGAKKTTSSYTTTSKSPIFFNLNTTTTNSNNSNNNNVNSRNALNSKTNHLPKKSKQSLATLNGIDSDDDDVGFRELKFK